MNAPTTAAGRDHTDGRLFVIASNNAWVHVYPDVQTMLDCKDTTAATPGALEFFDVTGRRLAPVFGATWALEGLRASAEEPDEAAVRARLSAVVKSVRASVAQRLAEHTEPPGSLEEALAHLPDLTGRGLAECFDLLSPDFGDGDSLTRDEVMARHDGSFWHNFWCH
jgi:hypothetical protein